MRRCVSRALLVSTIPLVLAACGTQTPPPQPEPQVVASYYDLSGGVEPPAFAAAIGVYDPDALSMASASQGPDAANLTDTGVGWFLGPIAGIGSDGRFAIQFPEADAELQALLVPVADMVPYGDPNLCQLEVSDAAVTVTLTAFEGVTVPGVLVMSLSGLQPAILTDEELAAVNAVTLSQNSVYGFAYASGPVEISATSAECEAQGTTIEASLSEGWNWVQWQVVLDETDTFSHAHLTDVEEPDEVKIGAVFSP